MRTRTFRVSAVDRRLVTSGSNIARGDAESLQVDGWGTRHACTPALLFCNPPPILSATRTILRPAVMASFSMSVTSLRMMSPPVDSHSPSMSSSRSPALVVATRSVIATAVAPSTHADAPRRIELCAGK